VKAVCVISAGFGEVGPEGLAAQERLLVLCRRHGMRMLGPNCMGLLNAEPALRMNATFATTFPRPGQVSVLSQSGAMGVAVLDLAEDLGLGMRMFASLGNKADVSGNDLLRYWEHDEGTRVVLMYLEDFGNPRKFIPLARRFTRTKPIVCVKAGRTAEGGRAAASHTGALAGADAAVDALLEQTGVLRVNSVREMFGVAQALVACPLPRGPRVAILTNAGGPAIMATDYLVAKGLTLATLAPATQAALRAALVPEASVRNPVDMVAAAGPGEAARTLELLRADPGVDLILTIYVPLSTNDPLEVARALFSAPQGAGEAKPVLSVFLAREPLLEAIKRLGAAHNPIYSHPEDAVLAAVNLVRARALRDDDLGSSVHVPVASARASARLAAAPPSGWLAGAEALALLADYGIPVTPTRAVADLGGLSAAARELGGPLALKLDGAAFLHKSDVGGVALRLDGPAEVEAAAGRMARAAEVHAPGAPYGFLLQRMARSGTELVLGVTTDPVFGPLLMVGLGGVYVEILNDVRFGLVPLTPTLARRMLRRLKSFPILEGARGHTPSISRRSSRLCCASRNWSRSTPRSSVRLEPLVARPDGVGSSTPACACAASQRGGERRGRPARRAGRRAACRPRRCPAGPAGCSSAPPCSHRGPRGPPRWPRRSRGRRPRAGARRAAGRGWRRRARRRARRRPSRGRSRTARGRWCCARRSSSRRPGRPARCTGDPARRPRRDRAESWRRPRRAP
jgi:acyl-CoA synthetase (NDP forming)